MSVTLRPVTAEDETSLFGLYASTRKEELDAWGWDEAQRQAFLEQQFRSQQTSYRMQFPSADHNIIMRSGRAIGRMMIDRGREGFRLIDIALLSEFRGSGIGTRLVQELVDEASAAGAPLRLQVLTTNPARRLYERLGFVTVGDDGLYLQMEKAANPDEPR